MRIGQQTSKLLAAAVALTGIVLVVSRPDFLGDQAGRTVNAFSHANPWWIGAAFLAFAMGYVTYVGSWRASAFGLGIKLGFRPTLARLGIGSVVNTFAPARAGDAVKIALISETLEGPDKLWTAGGVYAAVAASRAAAVTVLTLVASCTGLLPAWPAVVIGTVVVGVAAAARFSTRARRFKRAVHLVEGIAALTRSPRRGAILVGWALATTGARILAVAGLASAFSLPHPLLVALLTVTALDLSGALPLTPGNVGVASGAVMVALGTAGISVADSLTISVAVQALETLVSLSAGAFGAVYLARPVTIRPWLIRAGSLAAAGSAAALLGEVVIRLA